MTEAAVEEWLCGTGVTVKWVGSLPCCYAEVTVDSLNVTMVLAVSTDFGSLPPKDIATALVRAAARRVLRAHVELLNCALLRDAESGVLRIGV